jgi:hypothetical protein
MSYNPNSRGITPQAKQAAALRSNQTGGTLPKGLPVKLTSSGLAMVDVSVEGDIDAFAGVLSADLITASSGAVATSGTIENITTSFAVGSAVYINKLGLLTNVKPSLGVNGFGEGDFVIKIGMIAKNNDNGSLKDLIVQIQMMGQL